MSKFATTGQRMEMAAKDMKAAAEQFATACVNLGHWINNGHDFKRHGEYGSLRCTVCGKAPSISDIYATRRKKRSVV